MAERETNGGGTAKPVDQSLIAMAIRGLMTRVRDILPTTWFSPVQPLQPVAQQAEGRQWDYPVGYNLRLVPKEQEGVSFAQLRALADGYDVLRLLIERRKDQMVQLKWSIRPIDPKAKIENDPRITELTNFLRVPDGRTPWQVWLRMLLEDMIVCDDACIYPHLEDGDGIPPKRLELIHGDTIKPVIDASGRTPLPPDVAYQQILKGVPAVDYSADQLVYVPRNRRTHKVYGYGYVEQIMMTVNMSLRRQISQLQYFTDGSVPNLLITAPKEWNPDQIKKFDKWFQEKLAGDTAARRQATFIPDGSKPFDTKDALLKDAFDEWLVRIVCFAFSVAPQPFVKEMNRACYSMDTETLTERGWLHFHDITPADKIATYNPETKALEFHKPIGTYLYDYEGEMVRFHTNGVDVLVTPDHKMWVRGDHAKDYRKIEAQDVPRSQFYFVASVGYQGGIRREEGPFDVPMDDWLKLLGYFISEGGLSHTPNHYLFTLVNKSSDVIESIDSTLATLPFSYTKYPNLGTDGCQRWNVYGKNLCQWLKANVGGYCHEKRIPREYLDLPAEQLSILLDALMDGDGFWDERENRASGVYYTASKRLADDVQELAYKLGYCASISRREDERENRRDAYRVNICRREEHSLRGAGTQRTPGSVTRETYKGQVYCFEVPNHLFVTRRNGKIGVQGNTAETAKEAATQEGLYPIMQWVKDLMDLLIWKYWGFHDLEFGWDEDEAVDPLIQSQIDDVNIKNGSKSIDEIRLARGDEPIGMPAMIIVPGSGPVLLSELIHQAKTDPTGELKQQQQAEQARALAEAKSHEAPVDGAAGANGGSGSTATEVGNEPAGKYLAHVRKGVKRAPVERIDRDRSEIRTLRRDLQDGVGKVLKAAAKEAADSVRGMSKLAKDASTGSDQSQTADDILAQIKLTGIAAVSGVAQDVLEKIVADGAAEALAQIGLVADADTLNQLNEYALQYAKERGAYLVGKRVQDDGTVIDNPNAEYAIDDSTREMLRADVASAIEQGMSNDELADLIEDSYAFSPERAETIARTETAFADVAGNMASYKEAGVPSKGWIVGPNCCDECEALAGEVVPLDEPFSDGTDAPPKHPRCECDVIPVYDDDDDGGDANGE